MGLEIDRDDEGSYTLEALLRARGYPEDVIEEYVARRNARVVVSEEE